MARLCVSNMPQTHVEIAAKLIVCYAYALMHHLQGRREDEPFSEICAGIHIPAELQFYEAPLRKPELCKADGVAASGTYLHSLNRSVLKSETNPQPWANFEWHHAGNSMPCSSDDLLERISRADNKPLEVLLHLSNLLRLSLEWKQLVMQSSSSYSALLCTTNVERDKLENCASEMIDIMGKCERLVKSSIPLSWNRHCSRLLSLWTLTLPFVLVPIQGVLSVPTIAVMSWVLFSIEEIGHLVEDPFRQERYSIQLEGLCDGIRNDVLAQITSTLKS